MIVNESLRSRRKENSRREDVHERLKELEEREGAARRGLLALEEEVIRLRGGKGVGSGLGKGRILPREVWDVEAEAEGEGGKNRGSGRWWRWRPWSGDAAASVQQNQEAGQESPSGGNPEGPRSSPREGGAVPVAATARV